MLAFHSGDVIPQSLPVIATVSMLAGSQELIRGVASLACRFREAPCLQLTASTLFFS